MHIFKAFLNNCLFLLKYYSCRLIQNTALRKILTLITLLFGETERHLFFVCTNLFLTKTAPAPTPASEGRTKALKAQFEQRPLEDKLTS